MQKLYCAFIALLFFTVPPVFAQPILYISTGANFFISVGTTVYLDGLSLRPSANFNITGTNNLQRAPTVVHALGVTYINRVYRFSNVFSDYSGTIRFYYMDAELNGLVENSLTLNVYGGIAWNNYTANVTRNATANFVVTTGLDKIPLNELTLVGSKSALIAGQQNGAAKYTSNLAILDQNIPNPFTNSTTINYYLPLNDGNAHINFYDAKGNTLKSVKLNGNGKGSVDVKANELAPGSYRYTLTIGNNPVATRQMILTK